ncbi:PopZ family protein [Alsobacter sp. R-9]
MSASLKANEPSMEEILASIRRIIADDNGTAPADTAPAAPEPEPVEDADVLDLATLPQDAPPVDDDIEFREVEEPLLVVPPHLLKPEPAPPPAPAPAPAPVFEEPAPRFAAPPPPLEDSLLSEATNASVSAAFGALTSTIITQNARTLEDLVKDMLRPMLKAWLDENLPGLVERLVKAEIERVTRGPR